MKDTINYRLYRLSVINPAVLCSSCMCPDGFEGDRCETNINDCLGHKCVNNATCQDMVERYACVCPAGYTGNPVII